jgi:hypothetical protein
MAVCRETFFFNNYKRVSQQYNKCKHLAIQVHIILNDADVFFLNEIYIWGNHAPNGFVIK